jgi:hypothetical protein
MRYACELFAPLWKGDMDAFIKELKNAQEALGNWNDYRVLRDYVHALSDGATPKVHEGLPELVEHVIRVETELQQAVANDCAAFFAPEHGDEIIAFLTFPKLKCCKKGSSLTMAEVAELFAE